MTPAQIKGLNLPTRPTKASDTRAKKFGDDISVELDAINPNTLRCMVELAIQRHLSPAKFDVLRAAEESELEIMSAARRAGAGMSVTALAHAKAPRLDVAQNRDLRRLILLNRIRSACLQLRFYENELARVGIELKGATLLPDEAEALLEEMGNPAAQCCGGAAMIKYEYAPGKFTILENDPAPKVSNAELDAQIVDLDSRFRPPAFTDEALALRFASKHRADLRYVAVQGKWYVWTGAQWKAGRDATRV